MVRQKLALLLLAIAAWSISIGWGMAVAIANPALIKSVDPVPERYQTGQELYLENCSGCHIAIPPEVMPTETWKQLLEKPENHYGQSLTNIDRITQLLIWDYLRTFSRSLTVKEPIPLYIAQSRYFKVLHPKVKLPKTVTHETCVTCHPGASKFDFRTLTPEWEDAS
jgi:hypothetical protein